MTIIILILPIMALKRLFTALVKLVAGICQQRRR